MECDTIIPAIIKHMCASFVLGWGLEDVPGQSACLVCLAAVRVCASVYVQKKVRAPCRLRCRSAGSLQPILCPHSVSPSPTCVQRAGLSEAVEEEE